MERRSPVTPPEPAAAGQLRLRRLEDDAGPEAVADHLRALDSRPGMYYGSDYASDPVFQHEAHVFVDPAVRLTLAAGTLALQPLDAAGAAVVRHWSRGLPGAWRPDGAFLPDLPRWDPSGDGHHPAAALLRTLLAQFSGETRGLSLFGCWNADYWRLEGGSGADPAAARAVLYLPLSFLTIRGPVVRSVRFLLEDTSDTGGDAAAFAAHGAVAGAVEAPPAADDFPQGAYAHRVAQALDALARGDVLSVALSQAFRRRWSGSAAEAFAQLRRRYPMPEMYCVHFGAGEYLMGASPCMQARLEAGGLDIAPVCGTAPRGADALADASHAMALLHSEKEGAALALGTDEHLARLYRLCDPASVAVLAYRRVHHFQALIHEMAHIGGRLAAGADWLDVLLATSATATSTGVPKRSALALIAAAEASPRGWYTGAVGRIGVDGSLRIGTIMRPAWIRGDMVEIRTGSLLVGGSDPAEEEEETRIKAASLLSLLDQASPLAPASEPDGDPAAGAIPDGATTAVRGAPETATPCAPRVYLEGGNDPLQPITAGLLARCGAEVVEYEMGGLAFLKQHPRAAIRVLTRMRAGEGLPIDRNPSFGSGGDLPTLLLGAAAEAALASWGWAEEPSAGLLQPGLGITVHPCHDTPLADFGPFLAGDYPARRFAAADAPAELTVLATDGAGTLLAFRHRSLPVIGLLFRPESVLATGGQAGQRLLARLLRILAPDAFTPSSGAHP